MSFRSFRLFLSLGGGRSNVFSRGFTTSCISGKAKSFKMLNISLKTFPWPSQIGISLTGAIWPWFSWTRVEVKPIVLLVLLCGSLGKLIVGFKELIFTAPSDARWVCIIR